MKTITLQIGNSDDKLTQAQWALFVKKTDDNIRQRANKVYFSATSSNTEPWQNAAWIFDIYENASYALIDSMKELKLWFKQDSIAWTEGKTEFI